MFNTERGILLHLYFLLALLKEINNMKKCIQNEYIQSVIKNNPLKTDKYFHNNLIDISLLEVSLYLYNNHGVQFLIGRRSMVSSKNSPAWVYF